MNAAARATGINVESTRPVSRAERRAEAARVQALKDAEQTTEAGPEQPDAERETAVPQQRIAAAPVTLKPRKPKGSKRPFSTQLRAGTMARLDWITARGYVLTETVDDAINAYLDAAGIPQPDETDRMPD
jgi:hypothetical protein